MENNIGQIYIIGDLLNKGSVLLREKEAKELRERGFEVYSAIEDKSINDKSAHTVESNNRLHERIYTKDMNALYKSKTIIATPETFALGSICELGGMEVFNHLHDIFSSILTGDLTDAEKLNKLNEFLSDHPRKNILVKLDDIRMTDIPEIGMARSMSVNQFVRGCAVSAMNGRGACAVDHGNKDIMTWEEVLTELEKLKGE